MGGNGDVTPDIDNRGFQALLADYAALRAEWVGFRAVNISLFAVAIAVHGIVATVLVNLASLDYRGWIAAGAPLIPWLVIGFYVQMTVEAVYRGFYGRAVERSLLIRSGGVISLDLDDSDIGSVLGDDAAATSQLTGPLYFHVSHQLGSMKRQFRSIQVQNALGLLSLAVLTIAETMLFLRNVDNLAGRAAAGAWYLAYAVIDAMVLVKGFRGERLWASLLNGLGSGLRRSLDPRDSDHGDRLQVDARSTLRLFGFLALPRPLEFVSRGLLIFIGSFVFVFWAESGLPNAHEALRGLALFVGFELLFYQGRYLVNDLLGEPADRDDPLRVNGSRLPPEVPRPGLWMWAVARMAIGVALGARFGASSSTELTLIALAVIAACCVYDALRLSSDRQKIQRPGRFTTALAVLIGFGYGARTTYALVCAYLVIGDPAPVAVLAFGALYMGVVGVIGPISAWTAVAAELEASPELKSSRAFISVFRRWGSGRRAPWERGLSDSDAILRRRDLALGALAGLSSAAAFCCGSAMIDKDWMSWPLLLVLAASVAAVIVFRLGWVAAPLIVVVLVVTSAALSQPVSALQVVASLVPWIVCCGVQSLNGATVRKTASSLDWYRRSPNAKADGAGQGPLQSTP